MKPSPPPGDPAADVRQRLARALAAARPRSREALWQFVRSVYGLKVPRRAVCPGHVAPMEYLARAVLEPGRDLVVWASRGGAKTELGSVATHLDALLRPGCQVRILGGSLEQAEKMYEYLSRKWEGLFAALLAREPTARRTELVNGSVIEVLTQSPRSVRGQRVHRLRCDEVDEFTAPVWQAAQFVTQSGPGRDGGLIAAQMEVFSTMHRPAGPMAALVDRLSESPRGDEAGAGPDGPAAGPRLLRWCVWETIERCPPERSCSRCPLWTDCEGRAREAEGYFAIDDAIAQRTRSSRQAWEAEMLCLRPRADRLVFAEFEPGRHVAPVGYDAGLPLYRAIDFGYANPFVCLWVQMAGEPGPAGGGDAPGRCSSRGREPAVMPRAGQDLTSPNVTATLRSRLDGRGLETRGDTDLSGVQLRVLAEYVARERPIAEHAREMAARDPGPVLATYADPAGWQRSDVTGTGPCTELGRMGLRVRTPHAGVLEGVELVRRLLKDRPGGRPGLVVDPSCRWLVRAFQEYHWDRPADEPRSERPAKDGADHPLDALRYLVTGLFLGRGRVRTRRW